jgi:hypothetical protein
VDSLLLSPVRCRRWTLGGDDWKGTEGGIAFTIMVIMIVVTLAVAVVVAVVVVIIAE